MDTTHSLGLIGWKKMWAQLGVNAPDVTVFEQLITAHSEPHRKYHTLQHLDECLTKLEELRTEAVHPEEVELAVWFHDAVYDTRRKDNEERSAEWARATACSQGLAPDVSDRIYQLILATAHQSEPRDIDQKVVVDIDLAILAAPARRFEEYEDQIRQEYEWVPEVVFRARRCEILKRLLARQSIFSTRAFRTSYEAQARRNLERSLRELEA